MTKATVAVPDLVKFKRHRNFHRFFLFLAIVGFVDLVTRQTTTSDPDAGLVIVFFHTVATAILGPAIGLIVLSVLSIISGFWIIWLGIALYERKQAKKYKPSSHSLGA